MNGKPWITTHIEYMRENYARQPLKSTCDHLGRSYNSVRSMGRKLGICDAGRSKEALDKYGNYASREVFLSGS